MDRKSLITELKSHSATHQVVISTLLMAVIPSLSLIYIGSTMQLPIGYLSIGLRILIVLAVILLIGGGLTILLKFPRSIMRLRNYIEEISSGILPDHIKLCKSEESDDLKYVETGLNAVLDEMKGRMKLMKQKLSEERALRETIEQQQDALIKAERSRAMIQSLSAACHHIGHPATILKMRLCLLKQITNSKNELAEIEECQRDLRLILIVLDKLRAVSSSGENIQINGVPVFDELEEAPDSLAS